MASFVDVQDGINRQQLDAANSMFTHQVAVDPAQIPAIVANLARISERADKIKQKQLDESEVLQGYSGAQILELMKRQADGQDITLADKAALYAYTKILATHAEVQKGIRNQLMLLQQAVGQQASVPGLNMNDAITHNIPWLSDKQINELLQVKKQAQVDLEMMGVNTKAIDKDTAVPNMPLGPVKTVLLVGAGILMLKALVK